jgi:cytochrome P450
MTVTQTPELALAAAPELVPLDRTANGTTGGAAGRLAGAGALFDQHGDEHRRTRHDITDRLGAAGVERLRPVWARLLAERTAVLATHACPGARLARTQLADLLAALAPFRPTVVRARVDRRSALPGWRSLILRVTR